MKKIVIALFLTILGTIGSYAQFTTAAYLYGFWSNWTFRGSGTYDQINSRIHFNTETKVFTGFTFRLSGAQPWDWCFKVEVDNYVKPDKKIRKQHLKDDTWYEYTGWVEYYVTDEYPTIEKVLEKYQFPMISPKGETARAKRRAKATIKIKPYKKEPAVFNVWFDNVGVGFSFGKWPFEKYNSYVIQ